MAAGVRHLVFTINNPTLTPAEFLSKFDGPARYVSFQLEKGENGTPHYQGYVEFFKQKRYAWCSKNIAPGWWKKREGTREQARAYSQKGDTRIEGPWEHGEFLEKGAGRRADLERVVELAEQGKSFDEIARAEPLSVIRYPRGIERIVETHQPTRSGSVEVHLIHDVPGTRKSTWLAEKFGREAYWKGPGKWYTGYHGQDVIVLDEYRGQMPFESLLFLLRPIGYIAQETKGGFVPLNHTQVWITTNKHPRTWHDYDTKACEQGYEAIYERVNHVYKKKKEEDPEEIDKELYFAI